LLKHVLDVLWLDIHLQRIVVLIDDDALCIAFLHVSLEVAVFRVLACARSLRQRVASTGEEEHGKADEHNDVDPVHVEPGHLWLIVVPWKLIAVSVHF